MVTMITIHEWLAGRLACDDATRYINQHGWWGAWRKTRRGDWRAWFLAKLCTDPVTSNWVQRGLRSESLVHLGRLDLTAEQRKAADELARLTRDQHHELWITRHPVNILPFSLINMLWYSRRVGEVGRHEIAPIQHWVASYESHRFHMGETKRPKNNDTNWEMVGRTLNRLFPEDQLARHLKRMRITAE